MCVDSSLVTRPSDWVYCKRPALCGRWDRPVWSGLALRKGCSDAVSSLAGSNAQCQALVLEDADSLERA